MRSGGSLARHFSTSLLTPLVSPWQPASDKLLDRNIKVPSARSLLSPLGWSAFWLELLNSLERNVSTRKPTLEDVLFGIEAPGDGALLHRKISLDVIVSFALASRVSCQGKEVS